MGGGLVYEGDLRAEGAKGKGKGGRKKKVTAILA